MTQPHDNLFRAVFGDPAEAVGLLRAHLPAAVANGVQWSTLSVEDSAFVAPDLSATESDLLYSIRRRPDGAPAWLYVLVEHQSTVRRRDRWMRLRLLQYCCRIWERDRRRNPAETELRPIVPMVFYLGSGRWRHATEFSELFAGEVRGWRWLPRFEHVLIDHSETEPEGVRGRLKGRVAQLIMLAVCRAAVAWPALERALPLLADGAPGWSGRCGCSCCTCWRPKEAMLRAVCRGDAEADTGTGRRRDELRRGDGNKAGRKDGRRGASRGIRKADRRPQEAAT